MKKICIIAFTDNGIKAAGQIKNILEGYLIDESANSLEKSNFEKSYSGNEHYFVNLLEKNCNKKAYVADNFNNYDAFIFVGATGIAVRYIAPHIKSKDVDPAVIVLDEHGDFVIPLLSGHLGGANELASLIAEKLSSTPVITTATDINAKFAVDLWTKKTNQYIVDISKIKDVSSAVLKDEHVGLYSDFEIEGTLPKQIKLCDSYADYNPNVGIAVSIDENIKPFNITLNAVPKLAVIGVGCRKNTDSDSFENYILDILREQNISIHAVDMLASIDIKQDEKCILDFSKKYGIPFKTATADELMNIKGKFTASSFVKSITGVDNVCERSAAYFSANSKIILGKTSHNGMTCAIAVRDWKCKF